MTLVLTEKVGIQKAVQVLKEQDEQFFFQCNFRNFITDEPCNKDFSDEFSLREHQRLHTGTMKNPTELVKKKDTKTLGNKFSRHTGHKQSQKTLQNC